MNTNTLRAKINMIDNLIASHVHIRAGAGSIQIEYWPNVTIDGGAARNTVIGQSWRSHAWGTMGTCREDAEKRFPLEQLLQDLGIRIIIDQGGGVIISSMYQDTVLALRNDPAWTLTAVRSDLWKQMLWPHPTDS